MSLLIDEIICHSTWKIANTDSLVISSLDGLMATSDDDYAYLKGEAKKLGVKEVALFFQPTTCFPILFIRPAKTLCRFRDTNFKSTQTLISNFNISKLSKNSFKKVVFSWALLAL